jgi:hypothetical protein
MGRRKREGEPLDFQYSWAVFEMLAVRDAHQVFVAWRAKGDI